MNYALGSFGMLCDAIARHQHRPEATMVLPRRFVLHPAVLQDLRLELGPKREVEYLRFHPDGAIDFMGVPVIVDSRAFRAKMVTSDNIVEFL